MTNQACPICGRPFSPVDAILSEHDVGFQCRHCWNRVQGTGGAAPPLEKKPRIAPPRARAKTHGKPR